MSVGSSETEAIDACPTLTNRPGLLTSGNLQAPFVERNFLIGVFEIVVRENEATFQHQSGFDHARNT